MSPPLVLPVQRGFSSILLIAIVVLLASLTAAALRFIGSAQGSVAMDIRTLRAEQAANTALEWQRYRLRTQMPAAAACVGLTQLNVPLTSGNVQVTVRCSRTPGAAVVHSEAGKSAYSYAFTATACAPAGAGGCPNPVASTDYVERTRTGTAVCVSGPTACTW